MARRMGRAAAVRLLLDAGALLALERGERETWVRFKAGRRSGVVMLTHGGVVAQVWRGGSGRQALLALALQGVEVAPLDEQLGRRAGVLLSRAGASDAIDAALVAMAYDDDSIHTSDAADIQALVDVSGLDLAVVPV